MQSFASIETVAKKAVQNVNERIRVNRICHSRATVVNRNYQRARVFLDTRYFGMNCNYFAVPEASALSLAEQFLPRRSRSWRKVVPSSQGPWTFAIYVSSELRRHGTTRDATSAHRWNSRATYTCKDRDPHDSRDGTHIYRTDTLCRKQVCNVESRFSNLPVSVANLDQTFGFYSDFRFFYFEEHGFRLSL